jgi:hypothetical protein
VADKDAYTDVNPAFLGGNKIKYGVINSGGKKKKLTRDQRIAAFEKALNARFKRDGLPVKVK